MAENVEATLVRKNRWKKDGATDAIFVNKSNLHSETILVVQFEPS